MEMLSGEINLARRCLSHINCSRKAGWFLETLSEHKRIGFEDVRFLGRFDFSGMPHVLPGRDDHRGLVKLLPISLPKGYVTLHF